MTENSFSYFTSKIELMSLREQIQEDLICMLESQFGEVDYLSEVQDLACQIIVDNFSPLLNK